MSESYLIIGGSSDIALELITQLTESGHYVTVLARDESRVNGLKESGVNVVIGDGLVEDDILSAIEIAKEQGNGGIAGAAAHVRGLEGHLEARAGTAHLTAQAAAAARLGVGLEARAATAHWAALAAAAAHVRLRRAAERGEIARKEGRLDGRSSENRLRASRLRHEVEAAHGVDDGEERVSAHC